MERMKCIKDKLIDIAYEEINHNLKNLNTCELGEVIDIVKDLSEAIYYCEVTKAMQHSTVPETKKDGAICNATYYATNIIIYIMGKS